MTTFGEIVYMVLDAMKFHSDDAYYTEEHIIFLAKKFRALLLERKYKNSRNSTWQEMSDENMQQICLNLEPATELPLGCSGMWLRSVEEIPATLGTSEPRLFAPADVIHSMVAYVSIERMPYVGFNRWLRHIIYAAKSSDGHLYLRSENPQFLHLDKARMQAVFSDIDKATELSCDDSGNSNACDILQSVFPLEDSLIPSCIEMVMQELLGSRYAPEDKQNDAKDGLADAAVTQSRAARPAENSTYKPKEEATE